MTAKRIKWVDYVKEIACILVVLGHFFQSMVKAQILPETGLYSWFKVTIYYFHVPLFFICSGYLYQHNQKDNTVSVWGKNIVRKALSLGVPYFVFSSVTWLLKTVFSNAVNNEIGSLTDTLFFHPASPYWYLYCLFFIFLVTPTIPSKNGALVVTALAFAEKIIACWFSTDVYAVNIVLQNEIWFVIGMNISFFQVPLKGKKRPALVIGASFLLMSVLAFLLGYKHGILSFALGLLACTSIILLVSEWEEKMRNCKVLDCFSQYTMPIFLMHTIFAAPVQILLLKVGIENALIHIAVGLVVSFMGPIIAAKIMKQLKYPEFFLYPGKFIKIK